MKAGGGIRVEAVSVVEAEAGGISKAEALKAAMQLEVAKLRW